MGIDAYGVVAFESKKQNTKEIKELLKRDKYFLELLLFKPKEYHGETIDIRDNGDIS